MRDQLILLPGWGLGTAPMEPLANALRGLNSSLRVQIEPLPELESADPQAWLDELDANLPEGAWLGGWSLGGMLATALAERRGERCCGLLTLASNACFVAQPDWPQAMPEATFQAFYQICEDDLQSSLKRFSLLCSQGAEDARGLGRQLLAEAPKTRSTVLLQSLAILAALDNRSAVQSFRGPQLHLFAHSDGLVPAAVAQALLSLKPEIEVAMLEAGSHAFVLEQPDKVAVLIQTFLSEAAND